MNRLESDEQLSVEFKNNFIEFMIECNVLQFGNFTTKSGRQTPYFINTGNFKTGRQLKTLGNFYADKIKNSGCEFNALFGPAYKGISLVVCCCEALFTSFNVDMPFFFNRKEEKDHGEGGSFIGYKPKKSDKIAIVEDVLTAGTALKEILPKIKNAFDVLINHLFITVNRCEKILNSSDTATEMIKKQFNIETHAIVNIFDIRNFITNKNEFKKYLDDMDGYIEKYCVR